MFDGLLKSKFYCKCKSDIKQTRARVDLVKKKRNAMQKYLRNDIADLLRNELDTKAYGRAEGLLVEMNRTSCYEFVDQCCEHISKNVSAMDKQKECPEECREAVSSLLFAAARFADMPELRELRTLFSERYGNSLDYFVNKEFSEKMKSCLPSKESKLMLLQEIAAESGFDWDLKALENKLFNESAYSKNSSKETDDKVSRNEDGSPKKTDDRVHTMAETEKPKNCENLLEPKQIPTPPYTKPTEPNKPNHDRDKLTHEPESKPFSKSVRTHFPKPPDIDKMQQTHKDTAEHCRRILRFFDGDEEKMERLLQHYSKKSGPDPAGNEKGKYVKPHRTNRVGSLPAALVDGHMPEDSKKHSRTLSLDNSYGHVHPKLPPDYDDFVARLAELRRNRGK